MKIVTYVIIFSLLCATIFGWLVLRYGLQVTHSPISGFHLNFGGYAPSYYNQMRGT